MTKNPRSPRFQPGRVKSKQKDCPLCGKQFAARGLYNHQIRCEQKILESIEEARQVLGMRAQTPGPVPGSTRIIRFAADSRHAPSAAAGPAHPNESPLPAPPLSSVTSPARPFAALQPLNLTPGAAPNIPQGAASRSSAPSRPVESDVFYEVLAQAPASPIAATPASPVPASPVTPASASPGSPFPDIGASPSASSALPSRSGGAPAISGDPMPPSPPLAHPSPSAAADGDAPMADSFKIEYHPHSGRPPEVFPFEDFNRAHAEVPDPPIDQVPWDPFLSPIDFDFAELTLDAALSGKQIDAFIKLIRRAVQGEAVSFDSHKDVAKGWKRAEGKVTRFKKHVIKAPYKKETREYDLYTRNLWDYVKDILRDSSLVSRMEWDAHKLFRYDGPSGQWVRFVDEPLTANAAWGVQDNLEVHQKPFLLVLYADKTKLSSFGTQMGYPVVVRCGNLPVDIRNGEGPGGGRVVGWLPIVPEEASEKHKTGFVNLKRVVWHESFRKLLEPIANHSHTGIWFECGDGVKRCICPSVVILSADYEEQCMMSLIRGSGGLFPCPICLIPSTELSNFEQEYPKRDGEEVREILADAMAARTLREREEILSKTSLRPVLNAFLDLANSDPYAALSFDRLHAFHSGLWGHHLWKEFKRLVESLPKPTLTLIDQRFDQIPRWKGLLHFSEVMSSSFNDGSKHEAISKNILFAAHNILVEETNPVAYQLLCIIRTYLELDMYAEMKLHTEWSLDDGRFIQAELGHQLAAYKELTADDPEHKNWDFPKAHTHTHLFDDILAKGVTRNYNTKPNEKLHRPLKRTYHLRTNQRNVAPQILDVDHHCYVAGHMRDQIERYNAFIKAQAEKEEEARQDAPEDPEDDAGGTSNTVGDQHFSVGAKQRKQSIEDFVEVHAADQAFHDFAKRLGRNLTSEYRAHHKPLPDGQSIKFTSNSMITEYRLLRVNYASLVDWRQETDILRCNPMFYGMPRYDCVIVSGANADYCGRLIAMFTCTVGDALEPMALIQPYDRHPGPISKLDADLGFYRVHERVRSRSEFISLKSVIRGALLIPDFGRKGEYLLHDLVDADMYLRIKEMKGIEAEYV